MCKSTRNVVRVGRVHASTVHISNKRLGMERDRQDKIKDMKVRKIPMHYKECRMKI